MAILVSGIYESSGFDLGAWAWGGDAGLSGEGASASEPTDTAFSNRMRNRKTAKRTKQQEQEQQEAQLSYKDLVSHSPANEHANEQEAT